jgi:hypothetical protein|tara:strand:- start:16 stop:882 length:867 start_codon:yes stop_codon:yes gene_type:complete
MSNKDNGHFINLTSSDKAIINLRVTGKAELKKASELFSKLSKLANKALKSSKSASAFFRILEYEVESFNEFTEFFDVSPVALAAGMTQMRFHEIAVDNWDDAGATIDAKGQQGGKYKLPPPTMMLVLRSKEYQKKHGNIVMNDSLDEYGSDMAGISEIGYIYADDEIEVIEALEEHVPKDVLSKAVGAVTSALKESVNGAMIKLMKQCEYGTNESDSKEPEDVKREFAKQKVKKLLSGLQGDDFFNTLGEVLRDDEMRSFIQNDFDKWRKNEGYENVMPMPGEIHGEA